MSKLNSSTPAPAPHMRAKALPRMRPQSSPVRQVAREDVSRLFGHAMVRSETPNTRVASVLWVSESVVRGMRDPSSITNITVGDVVAIYCAGLHTLAIGFWEDVARFMRRHNPANACSPGEATTAVSIANGRAADAARRGDLAAFEQEFCNASRIINDTLAAMRASRGEDR